MKNRSTGRLGRLFFNAVTLESRSPGSVVMKKRNTTDAGLKPSSMTLCDERRGGFTLIELLVVVLIIGILSAIALPQYRLAVEKARAAQAVVNVRSLADSVERYWLANGEYPRIEGSMYVQAEAINKLGLDIIVPDIKGFYYVFYNDIYVAAHTAGDSPIQYMISKTLKNQTRENWSKRGMTCNTESKSDGNTLSHRLCKSLCATSKLEEVWTSGQYGCEIKS